MIPFDRVFAKLIGQWSLHKKISNGSFYRGQAQFTRQATNVFVLEESGILTLENTQEIQAKRRWIWEFSCDSRVNIFFDEPQRRLYHGLDFIWQDEVWEASAEHLCSPDVYEGHYKIADERIEITQDVKGPAKDYRMISNFERDLS